VGTGSANRRLKVAWMWVLQGQSGGRFSQRRRPPRVREVAGVWKTRNRAGPDRLNFSQGFALDPGCGLNGAATSVFAIVDGNYKIFDA
jgi:hypothetical protein